MTILSFVSIRLLWRALVGDAEPFSFLVPGVFFRFDAERHDRWPKKR